MGGRRGSHLMALFGEPTPTSDHIFGDLSFAYI